MQVLYTGLGGTGSVAFSIIDGQKEKKRYENFLLFYGIENLNLEYKKKCKKLKIKYIYKKKLRFVLNFDYLIKKSILMSPDVIIVHDISTIPFFIYSVYKRKTIIYVHHTPDKTKRIIDWLRYFINGMFCHKIVLVSKRKKTDLMHRLNNIFFKKKVNIIENGIDIKKFSK